MVFVRNESFKQYLFQYPLTSLIILINTFMFLYTSLLGGLNNAEILYEIGGISLEYIRENEYYRLFSYGFIHNGLTHFLFNVGYIIILCPFIEKNLGKLRYIVLFVCTILGTALSIMILSNESGVGASGFIYGVLGMYLAFVILKKEIIDKQSRVGILVFIMVGWILTFSIESISIAGHFGGFVIGVLLGSIYAKTNKFKEEVSA